MKRRWVLGLVVIVLLAISGVAVLSPTVAMYVRTGERLAMNAPPGWFASAGSEAGRYPVSWVAAQNKPMDPEALARTKQYRDYSVWKDIASDRVLVRVQTAFSPPAGPTALPDAVFPLDWSRAERAPDVWGFEVWQLMFAVNQVPYAVVVHIGSEATAYDRAAVRAALATIRP